MKPSARDIFDRSQPADETTAKEERHRLFACIVLVRVLRKCKALQSSTKDEHATHTKVLLDQTMEGLSIPKSADVSKTLVKQISRAVLSDIQKALTAEKLKNILTTPDPAVDIIIVKALQFCMKEVLEQVARKPRSFWRDDTIKFLIFAAGIICTFLLLAILL